VMREGEQWVALVGIALAAKPGSKLRVEAEARGRPPGAVRDRRRTQSLRLAAPQGGAGPGGAFRAGTSRGMSARSGAPGGGASNVHRFAAGDAGHAPAGERTAAEHVSGGGATSTARARNPHAGMDIAAPAGTPVVAASAGTRARCRRLLFPGPDRHSRPWAGAALALFAPGVDRRGPSRRRCPPARPSAR